MCVGLTVRTLNHTAWVHVYYFFGNYIRVQYIEYLFFTLKKVYKMTAEHTLQDMYVQLTINYRECDMPIAAIYKR
jgi:hypothetical protein